MFNLKYFFKAAIKVYIQILDDFGKILIKSYINFLLNSLEPNIELFAWFVWNKLNFEVLCYLSMNE